MWDYTDEVMEHFKNPRNVGKMPDANGIGEVGSLACGDALTLYLKINPETEIIEKATFQTFGCASAIASSSILTEMLPGMTLSEAQKITNDDIVKQLGGLPAQKIHCSVMGQEALEAAIANYRGETVATEDSPVICTCFNVTEKKIREQIREHGLTTLEEVTDYTKAGGACGQCKEKIAKILADETGNKNTEATEGNEMDEQLTPFKRMKQISDFIEQAIAPALQADGGDIEVVDIKNNDVYVKFKGACSGCPNMFITLKVFVEKQLQDYISPELRVFEASRR